MNVSSLPLPSMPSIDPAVPSEGVSGPRYEAAMKDFEGIFISMMLKEMRKTVGEGFFGGDKADAIGGLFDMTIGQELGRHGGLGITSALTRYNDVAGQAGVGQTQATSGEAQ